MRSPSMCRVALCASSPPLPLSGRLVWMRAGVGVDDSVERSLHQLVGRRQAFSLSQLAASSKYLRQGFACRVCGKNLFKSGSPS